MPSPEIRNKFLNITGAILIAGMSVPLINALLEKGSAKAESKPSKNQITLQSIENPYYFRYKNNDRRWVTDLDWGILPNDTERIMGTTYDFFNKDITPTNRIQPQGSKYPAYQLGARIATGAVGVDTEAGCADLLTAVERQEGNLFDPFIESVQSLDKPTDFSPGAREIFNAGFPKDGIKGNSIQGYVVGKDTSVGFVRAYFTNTQNLLEAGWYRAKRKLNSCLIDGFFIKEGPEDPLPFKNYLPNVFKNTLQGLRPYIAGLQYLTLVLRV